MNGPHEIIPVNPVTPKERSRRRREILLALAAVLAVVIFTSVGLAVLGVDSMAFFVLINLNILLLFLVLFLDNQNQLLASEEMFRGTINAASVYPREIVKAALQHNAAAVILAHNHPSGEPEPSLADRSLTERLLAALSLVDIRVLDHLVIGGSNTVSFAERGWL